MKKRNKIIQLIILATFVFSMQSCALFKTPQKDANTNLPDSFNQSEKLDSTNSAQINWNEFFEDPFLTALIDSALTNNKELNIIMQRINRANNEIMAKKGEYLPFVNGLIGADVDKVGAYTRNGAVEEHLEIKDGKEFPKFLGNFQFGLNASWELDVWKKLRNAKNVAILEYMASVEGKNFLITNLIAEIANSYYELTALDSKLLNLNENIAIQQNALRIVNQLQASARVNALAVKRFEAEVRKNQSEIYNIKQEIFETENRINFLVGTTNKSIARNTSNFTTIEPKVIKSGVPSQLLQNRPDIRQAEQELAAAKLNIKVAKANFFPSFGIHAGVGFEAFNPKFLINSPESILMNVAGEMIAPLINMKGLKAQYKNANSKQIQAAFEYEQTIINAYMEVSNQLSKIENIQKTNELQLQEVALLTESIGISNQLFQSARADYMEVLLTQRDALEAKMRLIETKKTQMIAMVNLYKSLGGGWQ